MNDMIKNMDNSIKNMENSMKNMNYNVFYYAIIFPIYLTILFLINKYKLCEKEKCVYEYKFTLSFFIVILLCLLYIYYNVFAINKQMFMLKIGFKIIVIFIVLKE